MKNPEVNNDDKELHSFECELASIYQSLLQQQVSMPEEFAKVIDENFWDLC